MSKNSKCQNFLLALIKTLFYPILFSMTIFCVICQKSARNHDNWKCPFCKSDFIEIMPERTRQIPPRIPINSQNVVVNQPLISQNHRNFSRPPMQIPLPPSRPELFVTPDGLIVSKPQQSSVCQKEISRRHSKITPSVLINPVACPICLENISSPAGSLPCDHSFHHFCIKKWIEQKPNCPLCQQQI